MATLSQRLPGHDTLPFIALLRVSPGGWWLILVGLKVRPVFSGKDFCPTVSLWSLLAQLSLEKACTACALEFLPALSPESGDQMSCMSAESNTVSGTPCLRVLHRLPRAAVSQLWSWKRRVIHCSQAQQKREGNSMDGGLSLCRPFVCELPHLIRQ